MKPSLTKSMILLSVIVMDLLTGMEFDLFVPSFAQIQSHFNLSPFWVEALLSVNFIGYSLGLFLIGSLADRYGRKPIILLGLVTFVLGSALCLMESFFVFLIIGRFLQGFGVAAPAILSFLIISDLYTLKEQQFLLAMLNGVMNVACAVAPVIGSYLTLYFHWQGNFTALLMLGLTALMMTIIFIPSYKLPEHTDADVQLGYLAVFKSKPLMLLIVGIIFIFVPYWIFVGMSSLLYIKDLGVSLTHFGYYQGVLAFVFAMGSVIFGFIIKHCDPDQKKMLNISIQIFIVSALAIGTAALVNTSSPMLITLVMLIFIIGQITSMMLYPFCLNFMPHAKARVSAIIQTGRLIFSAFALQIAGYFYQGSFRNIGIIIFSFILLAVITLFLVIKNSERLNLQSH